jgi:hypothetical protein
MYTRIPVLIIMMNDSEVLLTFWQNTSLTDHGNQTESEYDHNILILTVGI